MKGGRVWRGGVLERGEGCEGGWEGLERGEVL